MRTTLPQFSPVLDRAPSRPAALISVSRWGELRAERKLPGTVLRVLVAGQHAGGVERTGDTWCAYWYTANYRDRRTEHGTVDEAVNAVKRSGWARRLGARAASRVYWSDRAKRAISSARIARKAR